MPQDPDLYGKRAAKKQKREAPLSSSLAFASQMSSLLSGSTASSAGRPRPSKAKDGLFNVKVKRKEAAGRAENYDKATPERIRIKDTVGTEEEKQDFMRTKRKMEEKARLYAAMKRGDYIPAENEAAPLIDFDRKWAEKHDEKPDADSSSGSDNESDNDYADGNEMVEYTDEYGRTRQATRAQVSRVQRQSARSAMATADLEAMAGRPIKVPENVIYGDAIQSAAFNPDDKTYDKMESLASKRDRTPTPPPDAHFDGHAEIRNKGVGFYHFGQDQDSRKKAQDNLAAERENTEKIRQEREAAKEERMKLIAERRAQIGKKRAEKQANNFLEGMAGNEAS
ncbi:coiled-coil domain-containing protein 174 [Microdochium nivale]|nr:coiled-coil domain-containing protein 174 [Microdochium nivale]